MIVFIPNTKFIIYLIINWCVAVVPNVFGIHAFCRTCIRGQAQAATMEMPLAEGGVGLCCMVPWCTNPILYGDVRKLLKPEIRNKLDERILEENIGLASLSNLERCKKCNFAIEMEVDKQVNKVFTCLKCGAQTCRLCARDWDNDHFGISCTELDIKTKQEREARELEKKLSEAVIRTCPRCRMAFVKEAGCNKMTCRCGMTQCYLCRESGIGYDHYCGHLHDPDVPNFQCKKCNSKCFLYEDANKRDEAVLLKLEQIRKRKKTKRKNGDGIWWPIFVLFALYLLFPSVLLCYNTNDIHIFIVTLLFLLFVVLLWCFI